MCHGDHVSHLGLFTIYSPSDFVGLFAKFRISFLIQRYIPLVLLIQNMYSLQGLYLTVLEPITYKQTEWALYIGDWWRSEIASDLFNLKLISNKRGQNDVCPLHTYPTHRVTLHFSSFEDLYCQQRCQQLSLPTSSLAPQDTGAQVCSMDVKMTMKPQQC